ncbi:hypothetical protein ACSSS7_001429 [Eimeria intestinalis]
MSFCAAAPPDAAAAAAAAAAICYCCHCAVGAAPVRLSGAEAAVPPPHISPIVYAAAVAAAAAAAAAAAVVVAAVKGRVRVARLPYTTTPESMKNRLIHFTNSLSASWDDGEDTAAAAATAAGVAAAAAAAADHDLVSLPPMGKELGGGDTCVGPPPEVSPPAATDLPSCLYFSQFRSALRAEATAATAVAEGSPSSPEGRWAIEGPPKEAADTHSWERLWEGCCEAVLKVLFCINSQQQQQQENDQGFLLLKFCLVPDANGKVWVTKVSPFSISTGLQGEPASTLGNPQRRHPCSRGGSQGGGSPAMMGGPIGGGPPGEEEFRGLVKLLINKEVCLPCGSPRTPSPHTNTSNSSSGNAAVFVLLLLLTAAATVTAAIAAAVAADPIAAGAVAAAAGQRLRDKLHQSACLRRWQPAAAAR